MNDLKLGTPKQNKKMINERFEAISDFWIEKNRRERALSNIMEKMKNEFAVRRS